MPRKTIVDCDPLAEPDFSQSSFLLSVFGEGTFLSLLAFLGDDTPDPVTLDPR